MDHDELVLHMYDSMRQDVLKAIERRKQEMQEIKKLEETRNQEYVQQLMEPPSGLRRRHQGLS